MLDPDETDAERMATIANVATNNNVTVEFAMKDLETYARMFDVDDSPVKVQLIDGGIAGGDTPEILARIKREGWPETCTESYSNLIPTVMESDREDIKTYMHFHGLLERDVQDFPDLAEVVELFTSLMATVLLFRDKA